MGRWCYHSNPKKGLRVPTGPEGLQGLLGLGVPP